MYYQLNHYVFLDLVGQVCEGRFVKIPACLLYRGALSLIVDEQADFSFGENCLEHPLKVLQLLRVINIDNLSLYPVSFVQISCLLTHCSVVGRTAAHDQVETFLCYLLTVLLTQLVDRIQHNDPCFAKSLLKSFFAQFLVQ